MLRCEGLVCWLLAFNGSPRKNWNTVGALVMAEQKRKEMAVKNITKKIIIPKRRGASATTLHVVVTKNKKLSPAKSNVVFLLPGGPGANHSADVMRSGELADYATLVYMDPRGCGESEKSTNPDQDYTMDNYIKDVEEIRKQLGCKKIVVLGTSYGGAVAIGYALKYPNNLKKLILVATAASYRFMAIAKRNLKKSGTAEQIAQAKKLWSGTFANQREVQEYLTKLAPLYSDVAARKCANKSLLKFKPGLISYESLNLGFATFLRTYDYEHRLSQIKCPTLILAGDHDWIQPLQCSKIMAKKIKNSILKIYNSGHSIGIDAHDEYVANIKSFLMNAMI